MLFFEVQLQDGSGENCDFQIGTPKVNSHYYTILFPLHLELIIIEIISISQHFQDYISPQNTLELFPVKLLPAQEVLFFVKPAKQRGISRLFHGVRTVLGREYNHFFIDRAVEKNQQYTH